MKQEVRMYGRFRNDVWNQINGLDSVEHIIDRLKEEIDWEGYELWTHGSILNNVDTYDVDLTIMGPVKPKKINQLLEEVVRIGFEEQVYLDVKYNMSNELYDPVNDSPKTIRYANYQPHISIGGQIWRCGEPIYGLYLKDTKFPMAKTIGKEYKSPKQLI